MLPLSLDLPSRLGFLCELELEDGADGRDVRGHMVTYCFFSCAAATRFSVGACALGGAITVTAVACTVQAYPPTSKECEESGRGHALAYRLDTLARNPYYMLI